MRPRGTRRTRIAAPDDISIDRKLKGDELTWDNTENSFGGSVYKTEGFDARGFHRLPGRQRTGACRAGKKPQRQFHRPTENLGSVRSACSRRRVLLSPEQRRGPRAAESIAEISSKATFASVSRCNGPDAALKARAKIARGRARHPAGRSSGSNELENRVERRCHLVDGGAQLARGVLLP